MDWREILEAVVAVLIVVVGFVALVAGLSALFAVPVMLLWNVLLPDMFGFTEVTFLQAWGLNLLAGFLFKSTSAGSSKCKCK